MSDFFGKLKSGAGKVAFEAEKLARVNKAQGELGQLKRQVEAGFTKLGELYYHQYRYPGAGTPAFEDLCRQIEELEKQIEAKNIEIQQINAETYGAPAPQPVPAPAPAAPAAPAAEVPQTKVCPNCSREMAASVKFCPDCGTKMP